MTKSSEGKEYGLRIENNRFIVSYGEMEFSTGDEKVFLSWCRTLKLPPKDVLELWK